jgi:hypothetical protein
MREVEDKVSYVDMVDRERKRKVIEKERGRERGGR